MKTISVDLPEGTLEALGLTETELPHELRLTAAVQWYVQGRLAQEQAAVLAGLTPAAFAQEVEARRAGDGTPQPNAPMAQKAISIDEAEEAERFLSMVFDADQHLVVEQQLDRIYDQLDDWLLEGRFSLCDRVIELLHTEYTETCLDELDLGIGFLTITGPARHRLPARSTFAAGLKEGLRQRGMTDKELAPLFSGLV